MAQFEHENVCGMIGVVTVGEPMLLVMQLYEFGSLKSYISKEAGFVALNLPLSLPELHANHSRSRPVPARCWDYWWAMRTP